MKHEFLSKIKEVNLKRTLKIMGIRSYLHLEERSSNFKSSELIAIAKNSKSFCLRTFTDKPISTSNMTSTQNDFFLSILYLIELTTYEQKLQHLNIFICI